MSEKQELVTMSVEGQEVIHMPSQSDKVLAMAEALTTNPDVNIKKLQKLLDMYTATQEREAEQAFRRNMAALQEELPVIDKKGLIVVNGVVRSKYARYEDIKKAITPTMAKYGFSSTFKTSFSEGKLIVEGTVSHEQGHQESTTVELPYDASGSKNQVQAVGSSIQYGKRYALCMLLDIATGGEDDDAQSTDEKSAVEGLYNRLLHHNQILREEMSTVLCIVENISMGELSTAKVAWNELDQERQRALWVATTKGGIFTTAEREMIKSKAWIDA